ALPGSSSRKVINVLVVAISFRMTSWVSRSYPIFWPTHWDGHGLVIISLPRRIMGERTFYSCLYALSSSLYTMSDLSYIY
ncbi:hypothetical protein F4604DRAFT_1749763, partial [Suillus subluteus]